MPIGLLILMREESPLWFCYLSTAITWFLDGQENSRLQPDQTHKLNITVQSAVVIAHNPVFHSRPKHIESDVFFIWEHVLYKQLLIYNIPALDQWADVLHNPLSTARFDFLEDKLKGLSDKPQFWGVIRV